MYYYFRSVTLKHFLCVVPAAFDGSFALITALRLLFYLLANSLIEHIKSFTYIDLCTISYKLKLTLFKLIYKRENYFSFFFTLVITNACINIKTLPQNIVTSSIELDKKKKVIDFEQLSPKMQKTVHSANLIRKKYKV